MPHENNQSSPSVNTDILNGNPDMSIEEGVMITHDVTQSSSVNIDILSFTVDNPDIINKVDEFHRTLVALQNVLCNVCLEQFPTFASNTTPTDICCRCNLDTQIPKLYSLQNNMDPGPVPLELSVSAKLNQEFIIYRARTLPL